MPKIQRLRAAWGSPSGSNQVQGAPSASAVRGRSTAPRLIAMAQPARIAALAAMSLVFMPPLESAEPTPPAMASICGVTAATLSSRSAEAELRGSAV